MKFIQEEPVIYILMIIKHHFFALIIYATHQALTGLSLHIKWRIFRMLTRGYSPFGPYLSWFLLT